MASPKFFFDNRFADAVPFALNTASGNYNAANVADMRPYTWWKPSAMGSALYIDCGLAKSANYALIYGHDLYTQGSTVLVYGSPDSFSTNIFIASATPGNNNPLLMEFAAVSYRYWQIVFIGPTAPSIPIAMIGTSFVMPSYLKQGFDPLSRKLMMQSNNNDNGQPLGKIIDYEQFQQTLQFGFVNFDWLRNTWQPAWRSNLRGQPVMFGWNTDTYPQEIYLVSVGDNYQTPAQAGGNWADMQFDVSGVGI